MNSSMRRASFGVRYLSSWKSFTAPPKRQGNSLTSKRTMGAMPLTPSTTLRHAESTVLPTGEMMPRPVTTTRRLLKAAPVYPRGQETRPARPATRTADERRAGENSGDRSGFGAPIVDVGDRLLHGRDLLGLFIRN